MLKKMSVLLIFIMFFGLSPTSYLNSANAAGSLSGFFNGLIGDPISIVKGGTLSFDKSVRVGDAFENYQFITCFKWDSLEDVQKRKIVEFTADINVQKIVEDAALDHKDNDIDMAYGILGFKNFSKNKELISRLENVQGKVLIQFLINADMDGFYIGYHAIEMNINGEKLDFAFGNDNTNIIKSIYQNQAFIGVLAYVFEYGKVIIAKSKTNIIEASPKHNGSSPLYAYNLDIDTGQAVAPPNSIKSMVESSKRNNFQQTKKIMENITPKIFSEQFDKKVGKQYNEKGLSLNKQGDTAEALKMFQSGYSINKSDVELVGNLGYLLFLNGRYDEAESKLIETLEIKPDRASSWFTLGQVYGYKKMESESYACFVNTCLFSRNINTTINFLEREKDKPEEVTIQNAASRALNVCQTLANNHGNVSLQVETVAPNASEPDATGKSATKTKANGSNSDFSQPVTQPDASNQSPQARQAAYDVSHIFTNERLEQEAKHEANKNPGDSQTSYGPEADHRAQVNREREANFLD